MNDFRQAREAWKCTLSAEVLHQFGELRLRLTGTSMLPTLWPDDLLTLEPVDFPSVRSGDLVLYRRQNRFVLHRFLEFERRAAQTVAITRGDAAPHRDEPITSEELVGRVTVTIRRGRALMPGRSLSWLSRCCGLALFHCDRLRAAALRLRGLRLVHPRFRLQPGWGRRSSVPHGKFEFGSAK